MLFEIIVDGSKFSSKNCDIHVRYFVFCFNVPLLIRKD